MYTTSGIPEVQTSIPRSKNQHSHARTKLSQDGIRGSGEIWVHVRRTAKGGATFEHTSAPLHTTPRSLFFARGAGGLWGYFARKKVLGGEMGAKSLFIAHC